MQHVQFGQQIEELEHEADFAIANARELPGRGVVNHGAIQLDRALGRRVQAAEDVHQGGLAAAGWTNDGNEFAFVDIERHIIQRADFLAAEVIDFADVAQFNQNK